MSDPILVERRDDIEIWTLNLPEERNPMSGLAMIERIEGLVAAANRDVDLRAIILTGSGTTFSTGGNVKHMVDRVGMFNGNPYELADGYRRGIQRIPRALVGCAVPVIAAVNGPAVGAGCDLACMCDLRIASTRAWFAESFVALGIVPGDGGAWLLPRIVGQARAREMAFTGDRIDASTALAWGLVSQVVEPDELLPAALALAERIAANPPTAVRMTKRLLADSSRQTLDEVLELSAAFQAIAHHTNDHREALGAAMDKRPGRYAGR